MLSSCEGKKQSVHRAIAKGFSFGQALYNSSSLFPDEVKPTCVKMVITPDYQRETVKSKGKSVASAYLTKEELDEFNLLYKIPKTDCHLLPKSNFLSLQTHSREMASGDEADRNSPGPVFSLSKWSLWQTRPQRIHSVTHSSKTLLFCSTVEEINFSTDSRIDIDQSSTALQSCVPPSPVLVDLCDDDSFFDPVIPIPSPPQNFYSHVESGFNPAECTDLSSINSGQAKNLLSKLFGLASALPLTKISVIHIEKPPNIKDLEPIHNNYDFKPFDVRENKVISTLHILNKKMKAQLKKRTKELNLKFTNSILRENLNESLFLVTKTADDSNKISTKVDLDNSQNQSSHTLDKSNFVSSTDRDKSQTVDLFTNFSLPVASFDISFSPSPSKNIIHPVKDLNNTSSIAQKLKFSPNVINSSLLLSEDFTIPVNNSPSPTKKQTSQRKFSFSNKNQTTSFHLASNLESPDKKKISTLDFSPLPAECIFPLDEANKSQSFERETPLTMKQTSLLSDLPSAEKQTSPFSNITSARKQTSPFSDSTSAKKQTTPHKEDNNSGEMLASESNETNHSPPPSQRNNFSVKNCNSSPEAIEFDISFDMFQNNSFFKDDFENLNDHAPSRNSLQDAEIKEDGDIDKNVSLILDQLSSNHKHPSSPVESLLTQPLTVKKIVLEREYKKKHDNDSFSSLSEIDSVNQMHATKSINTNNYKNSVKSDRKALAAAEIISKPLHSNSASDKKHASPFSDPSSKRQASSFSDSLSAQKHIPPLSDSSSRKQTFPQSKNSSFCGAHSVSGRQSNAENTQYSLTQMLSFIESTEKFESLKNNVDDELSDKQPVLLESSEEEIEPTPPKENISQFLYRNNSLNEDSNSLQACDSENKTDVCNKAFCEKLSFDLSDIKFSSSDEGKHEIGDACRLIEKTPNEDVLSPECLDNLFFDISFEQPEEDLTVKVCEGLAENLSRLKSGSSLSTDDPDKNQVPALNQNLTESKIDLNILPNNSDFKTNANSIKPIKCPDSLPSVSSGVASKTILEPVASTSSGQDNFTFKQPTSYKLSKRKQAPHNLNSQAQPKYSINTAPKVAQSFQNETVERASTGSCQNEFEDFDFNETRPTASSFLSKAALKRQHSEASNDPPPKKVKISSVRKRNGKKKFNLILSQADVSGSDSSDGEEGDDFLEESFIDDVNHRESSPDQRAMYLQSIKNCAGLPQRYKLKMNVDCEERSFSHLEQSDYLFDSFCVGDEDVQFCSPEEEVLEEVETKRMGKKRKRIVTLEDSSSSDDDFVRRISGDKSVIEQTENETKPLRKKSHNVLSSDEESLTVSRISDLVEENKKSNDEQLFNVIFPDGSSDEDDDFVTKISPANDSSFARMKNEKSVRNKNNSFVYCSENENILESKRKGFFDKNVKSNDSLNKTNRTETLTKASKSSDLAIVDEPKVNNQRLNSIDLNFSFDVGWNENIPDVFPSELNQYDFVSAKNSNIAEPSTSSCHNTLSKLKIQNSEKACSSTESRLHGRHSAESNPLDKTSDHMLCEKVNFPDRPTILVDSRELAGGKPIISLLRNKYGINPVVMQLTTADYVISNRLAVERILDSEFSASVMPVKVIDKVKLMCDAYEKSFVIIQADCRKRVLGFNKLSSKYQQFSLNVNLHPSARVLFSNSFEESATLLSDIVLKEQRSGTLIDVPVVLNPTTQLLFDFYHSCPQVTPICALRFAYHFPVVSMFLNSSVDGLKKAGSISTLKATSILEYFKSEILFDAYS